MTSNGLQKRILAPNQLSAFQSSKTHSDIVSYIETLNDAVVGVKLADECPQSSVCTYPFQWWNVCTKLI
jgi:serine/threonine-protein phosphatase 2A activator